MSVPDGPSARPVAASTPLWVRNPALVFGLAAGVFLAGLGLVTGRPELVVVALPALVTAAFGARRHHAAPARTTIELAPSDSGRGVGYRAEVALPATAEAVAVEFRVAGDRRHVVVVGPRRAVHLTGTVPVTHSGPQEVLRTHLSLLGRGGTAVSVPDAGPVRSAVVPPPHLRMQHLPMPKRVTGITGAHDSTRPGDGGEFRDVALFAPGDRSGASTGDAPHGGPSARVTSTCAGPSRRRTPSSSSCSTAGTTSARTSRSGAAPGTAAVTRPRSTSRAKPPCPSPPRTSGPVTGSASATSPAPRGRSSPAAAPGTSSGSVRRSPR